MRSATISLAATRSAGSNRLIGVALAALLTLPRPVLCEESCVTPSNWVVPTGTGPQQREPNRLMNELSNRPVVLLGEDHDNPEHHRWQLHTIAALHAYHPNLALGFEMFPRRVQGVLDQWVAGELTVEAFLQRSEWNRVWGFDPHLYLPIFHFARMHRVPMIALNVDRSLVAKVGEVGWASIPASEREGVTDPAPPSEQYRETLYKSYLEHQPKDGSAGNRAHPDYNDPGFRHFVESMQVWDRAMAQAIAQRRRSAAAPLVVGIMGRGHLENGFGVPHQLRDLGIPDAAVLLPWDAGEDCKLLGPGFADAVFGLAEFQDTQREHPRLGVILDGSDGNVVVRKVAEDSVAAQAGVQAGDVVVEIAGRAVQDVHDVIDAVRRQAPGTWLPLTVKRAGEPLKLVARFPPQR